MKIQEKIIKEYIVKTKYGSVNLLGCTIYDGRYVIVRWEGDDIVLLNTHSSECKIHTKNRMTYFDTYEEVTEDYIKSRRDWFINED